MPIVTLRDLYVADLNSLWDAEQQILQELPAMAARATSGDLRQVLEDHQEETRVHIERLALLFRRLDEGPGEQPCEAIRGLVQDNRRQDANTERGEVLDAALIAAVQRIEHYEIAAYGCVRAYAVTLGDDEAAHLLQQTLEEEDDADRRLTDIAEQGINQAAGADILEAATTYRSRLRYVAIGNLRDLSYREFRVVNEDAEDLGALDGLIVDGRTGLPLYVVVDAGGWFAGRRYVVPSSALQRDDTARLLRTSLGRDVLRRYPEFSASAFPALDDTDMCKPENLPAGAQAPPPGEHAEPHRVPGVLPGDNGAPAIASQDAFSGADLPTSAKAPAGRRVRRSRQDESPVRDNGDPSEAETDAPRAEAASGQRPAAPPSESEPEVAAQRIERYRER